MKSIWSKQYSSLNENEMIEQCVTLCPKIESCDCTNRLLIILKIYQSIMYNRKQKLWNDKSSYIKTDELLSMYHAITDGLKLSLSQIINDFYHCRFYHGHFNRWYEFCRTHYEENYCVYEFIKYDNNDEVTYKRHCSIYSRYHRNKSKYKSLSERRDIFRIRHYDHPLISNNPNDDEEGLSDDEINEIISLQICDMIHCFMFHSNSEPHLLYAHESLKPSNLKIKERNKLQTQKFEIPFNKINNQNDDNDEYEYNGESLGVLISYKDKTHTPQHLLMKDELINHPIAGISKYQYADVAARAAVFQNTFIGRQMVNFFGKHINLQQIIACMAYTNYVDLQKAFTSTLHSHNEDDETLEAKRKSHCKLFWHFSKILFSVVDNFGDPLEKDCQHFVTFENYKTILLNNLHFGTECIYSTTSDKLAFAKDILATDHTKDKIDIDEDEKKNEIIAVIGARRLGSLYFDVSLLSDYPHENEVLLGPSEHLEIRNLIVNDYDCSLYFGAMYIMDALTGHRLSFDYQENENYQMYLTDVIKNTLHYVDGQIELEFGQKLCYHYWENKSILRWNIREFMENISIEQLKKYFLTINASKDLISFHFVNTIMLFPNVKQIEINEIALNVFLCDNLLELIGILTKKNDSIHCGQKLKRIQLFGDENDKHYVEFIENKFDEYVIKFKELSWSFTIESDGNWLFLKN